LNSIIKYIIFYEFTLGKECIKPNRLLQETGKNPTMSFSIISTLEYATRQISIYLGIPMLIVGVIGGFLNIIVFLSLRTFRQNACAFYLTVMSFLNIGLLLTGLLSRIMISGFEIDWTQTSSFYCKCRVYINQFSILMSLTCICLATIDQFLSTNSSIRIQQGNNIKLARYLIIVFIFIWLLHGIPYLIYYNIIISPKTRTTICSITSSIFQDYTIYGFLVIFSGILPLLITSLFGLLAYHNIKQIAHRRIPLVRRELDKQMTIMVLVHVIFDLFTLVPYIIISIIALDTTLMNDPIVAAHLQFLRILTIYFYYLYFVVR
jgi:hypothetical protein